jgi:FAD/FMN-containing dehydrogenase
MTAVPTVALDRLRQILGPTGFLDAPGDLEAYLVDFRRLYRGSTALVARPSTVDQVAGVVATCAEFGLGVVPHGGNTSYCGGATPRESGADIVLSLQRLNRIRQVDAAGYALTLDAGCTLLQAQEAAAGVERLLPLSLGSEGSCQVGGNLSTNAGGTSVLRYGMMRDLVLGLEVVLPDGRVLDQLRSLRKDNTGYDVKQLFVGAEGTLGVITGACLKLFARPAAYATALLGVEDLAAAVRLLAQLRDELGDSAVAFEVMPRIAVELAVRHVPGVSEPLDQPHPWYVLAEVALPRAAPELEHRYTELLAGLIERGLVRDAVLASSEAQRLALWHLREHVPEAQTREGASLKHDISLPIAALPEFVAAATTLLAGLAPGARIVGYGHLGDGNLHFNLSPPVGGDDAAFLAQGPAIKRAIHDLVAARGGSFSAEHGIGRLKVDELARYENPVALELMRSIKRTLDPRGIMNPGKVL